MTKHFLKTLLLFTVMIFIGLLGVFLVSYFDEDIESMDAQETEFSLAK